MKMTKKDFIIELRNIGMTQADFFKLAGRKTRSLTNVKDDEEIATWHINFLKILKDLRSTISGKNVLVVEDIIDSGFTLKKILQILGSRNPKKVSLCTLLDKPERREVEVEVQYVGFQIPNEFVVGYGLDFDEKYRNLEYIGIAEPSVFE